jgi:hypothetical protein
MPHIKLTDTTYIAAECIEIIRQDQRYGQPCVEVIMKRQDLSELYFYGDEGSEAWTNWKGYMQHVEENRRADAEDDQQ